MEEETKKQMDADKALVDEQESQLKLAKEENEYIAKVQQENIDLGGFAAKADEAKMAGGKKAQETLAKREEFRNSIKTLEKDPSKKKELAEAKKEYEKLFPEEKTKRIMGFTGTGMGFKYIAGAINRKTKAQDIYEEPDAGTVPDEEKEKENKDRGEKVSQAMTHVNKDFKFGSEGWAKGSEGDYFVDKDSVAKGLSAGSGQLFSDLASDIMRSPYARTLMPDTGSSQSGPNVVVHMTVGDLHGIQDMDSFVKQVEPAFKQLVDRALFDRGKR